MEHPRIGASATEARWSGHGRRMLVALTARSDGGMRQEPRGCLFSDFYCNFGRFGLSHITDTTLVHFSLAVLAEVSMEFTSVEYLLDLFGFARGHTRLDCYYLARALVYKILVPNNSVLAGRACRMSSL